MTAKTEAVDKNQFRMAHARKVKKSAAEQSRVASAAETCVDAQIELASSTAPRPLAVAANVSAARRKFRKIKGKKCPRVPTGPAILNSSINALTVAARPIEATTIQAMVSAIASRTAAFVKRNALP